MNGWSNRSAGVWWPGLLAVGLALALHVVGFVVQQPRLSMVALFFGAWGLIGLVWGWADMEGDFFSVFHFRLLRADGGNVCPGSDAAVAAVGGEGDGVHHGRCCWG